MELKRDKEGTVGNGKFPNAIAKVMNGQKFLNITTPVYSGLCGFIGKDASFNGLKNAFTVFLKTHIANYC